MTLRLLALPVVALAAAAVASAQTPTSVSLDVDALVRAELGLGVARPERPEAEPVTLPTGLLRCDSPAGRLRYGCEPVTTALGLAASTAVGVLSWVAFARGVSRDSAEQPADSVGDAFTYGFFLPVAVGSTALAGYSGYRLIVLLRSP